jgi:hypothetical protein
MQRQPAATDPPTYTSQEVSAVFHGLLTPSALQSLDRRDLLRPSYYYDPNASGGLIPREERDRRVLEAGSSQADPHRRYTYIDVVWIRLFLRVKGEFGKAAVPNPTRRASEVITALRSRAGDTCPPAWRLVIFGRELYLVTDDMTAESFGHPGQLGLVQFFETVHAEVRGRVTALAEHKKIRALDFDAVGIDQQPSRSSKMAGA